MKKFLLALALCLASSAAWAQNPTCPDRPASDSSNACANTRFVHNAVSPTTVVTSVGGMSGVLLCGTGLVCSSQTISATTTWTVPSQTTTGTAHTFVTGDCGKLTLRSNSNALMGDTLATTGLSAGCVFSIKNANTLSAYVVTVSGATLDGSATGNIILGVNQSATVQFDGTNFHTLDRPLRLTAAPSLTFYVCASGGSDNNTGLSAAQCWATRQHAWIYLQGFVDTNAGGVIIHLQDGTYVDVFQASGAILGQGEAAQITFEGNCTTPTNVVIDAPTLAWAADDEGMFGIRCMELTTSLVSSNLVISQRGGSLIVLLANANNSALSSITFAGGAATGCHLVAQQQGQIVILGNHTIQAGGLCFLLASAQGLILFINNNTITNNGGAPPDFSLAFAVTRQLAFIGAVGLTFNNGCTGVRYDAGSTGIIYTGGGGANYFCGNSAGVTSAEAPYQ